jgi:hypothetical protein
VVVPVEAVDGRLERAEAVVRVVVGGDLLLRVRPEAGEVEQEPAEAVRPAVGVGVGEAEVVGGQLAERGEDVRPVVEELLAPVRPPARVAAERALGVDAVDDEDLAQRKCSGSTVARVRRSR